MNRSPGLVDIVAPYAGTIYLKDVTATSKRGSKKQPFVKVGDRVKRKETVVMIEALSIYRRILAGTKGSIAEICVEHGKFVDRGVVIAKIRPA